MRPLREARAQFEREYIVERLTANEGNLGETARELGLDRSSLYLKMKQLNISGQAGTGLMLSSSDFRCWVFSSFAHGPRSSRSRSLPLDSAT